MIATEVFGDSPSSTQWSSVNYLVSMRQTPTPNIQSFMAHMQEKHLKTTQPVLAGIWRQYKEFFVLENQEHDALKKLMNMRDMVTAFEAAPFIEVGFVAGDLDDTTAQPSSSPIPLTPQLPFASAASRSSNPSHNENNGNDIGSFSTVSLAKMRLGITMASALGCNCG